MRQEDLAIGEQDRADAENKFAITQAWNGTEIASRREQDKEEMLSRERIARMGYDQRAAAQSQSPQALPIPLKAEIAALRKYPDAQTAIVSPEMQRLLQQYPQFAYELTGALGELYEGGLRPESFIDQQMRTASEPGAPGAPGEPGAPGAPAQFSYDPATGGLRPRVR